MVVWGERACVVGRRQEGKKIWSLKFGPREKVDRGPAFPTRQRFFSPS